MATKKKSLLYGILFVLSFFLTPLVEASPHLGKSEMTAPTGTCSMKRVPVRTVKASWYGSAFQGKLMANGKPFDMHKLTVAHKHLPLGSRICIRNPRNGKEIIATVTDRGPYVKGRDIDLSKQVALQLGLLGRGVSHVEIFTVYL